MRPTLIYASLLTAFVLTGCGGDGATSPDQSGRARMGASAAATAAAQPVIFSGVIAHYTVTKTDAGYVISDTTGAEAPRTVPATARLRFADMSLAFDVDGTPGQAYRLYRAAFARAAEPDGLGFWINSLDSGVGLYDVATGFTESEEYRNLYASAKTSRDYISRYYVNVLNREGEPGGMDYWTNILETKRATLAGILRDFSESEENKTRTSAAIAAGIRYVEYGVRYPAMTYPVRAAYVQREVAEHTDYLTVSGTCSGAASFTYGAPAATVFEGQTVQASNNTVSLGVVNCSPSRLDWTLTDYYDNNQGLLGHARSGNSEYDVGGGSLPATAKVGDAGTYATQTAYASSARKDSIGQRTLSYALDADGASATTAILTLKAVRVALNGVPALTRTSRYRISKYGALQLLSVDEVYDYGVQLTYTPDTTVVQPAKLTITDTVPGTGAVAQIGNTLAVHYTGWLYDPKAPGFKGQQFDSSAGRSPFSLVLGAGNVIQGWEQGLQGMRAGGKRTLLIPSSLGYGPSSAGSIIKGNSALVFEVELVSVK